MNKFYALLLAAVLCFSLSSCSGGQQSAEPSPKETEPSRPTQTFPFQDDEGRLRYRLVINGEEVKTKNYPFTYPDSPKCGYYPLEDVLAYLKVECPCSEDEAVLTTKVNGNVVKVTDNVEKMQYGKSTIAASTGGVSPVVVDGVLYVPSILFMLLTDKSIVNFTSDRSAATLDTDIVIDPSTSGTAGLRAPYSAGGGTPANGGSQGGTGARQSCGTCGGSGRSICTYCSGTGSKIEYQQTYDPISHQYKQTQKKVFCSRCSGRGSITCPSCGGTGKR